MTRERLTVQDGVFLGPHHVPDGVSKRGRPPKGKVIWIGSFRGIPLFLLVDSETKKGREGTIKLVSICFNQEGQQVGDQDGQSPHAEIYADKSMAQGLAKLLSSSQEILAWIL